MKNTQVVVLGGGFAGAYCAHRLERLGGENVDATVIDRHNYLLFYPLLVEAGTGSLEPRHTAVPLRILLRDNHFRMADVVEVDTAHSRIAYRIAGDGPVEWINYDHLVLALGSASNLPPVPGLAEFAFTMKSLGDAVSLRDRMIQLLERADAINDAEERRRLLHIVVAGGSFTGIEVAGEYLAFLKRTAPLYPRVDPKDIRVTLVEMLPRILPALEPEMSAYVTTSMQRRGVDFVLQESIKEIGVDHAILASGKRLDSRTVIWCTGIAPNPLVREMKLPTDPKGWILTEPDGRVKGFQNVWGAGDCAVNIDPKGRPYAPTAQSAVGEGHWVADNILRVTRGESSKPISFHIRGSVTPLGGHNAVVQFGTRYFSGLPAWIVYRCFYLSKIPGFARKARVALDWVGAMFTAGDAVQLNLHSRRPPSLSKAAGDVPAKEAAVKN